MSNCNVCIIIIPSPHIHVLGWVTEGEFNNSDNNNCLFLSDIQSTANLDQLSNLALLEHTVSFHMFL